MVGLGSIVPSGTSSIAGATFKDPDFSPKKKTGFHPGSLEIAHVILYFLFVMWAAFCRFSFMYEFRLGTIVTFTKIMHQNDTKSKLIPNLRKAMLTALLSIRESIFRQNIPDFSLTRSKYQALCQNGRPVEI